MDRRTSRFQAHCVNATDNELIKIALDEAQKVEHNEDSDFHVECAQIAAEEMERRGLDVCSIQGAHEDFDQVA